MTRYWRWLGFMVLSSHVSFMKRCGLFICSIQDLRKASSVTVGKRSGHCCPGWFLCWCCLAHVCIPLIVPQQLSLWWVPPLNLHGHSELVLPLSWLLATSRGVPPLARDLAALVPGFLNKGFCCHHVVHCVQTWVWLIKWSTVYSNLIHIKWESNTSGRHNIVLQGSFLSTIHVAKFFVSTSWHCPLFLTGDPTQTGCYFWKLLLNLFVSLFHLSWFC